MDYTETARGRAIMDRLESVVRPMPELAKERLLYTAEGAAIGVAVAMELQARKEKEKEAAENGEGHE